MFWRLTTVADDFGRFEASPKLLLANCFPLKVTEIKLTQIKKWYAELEVELVQAYEVDGRRFGVFRNWEKYQRGRAKASKFPEPPSLCPKNEHDDKRQHMLSDDDKRQHMQGLSVSESVSVCVSDNTSAREREQMRASDDARELASLLDKKIQANNPDRRPPPKHHIENWAQDIDKLNRLDGKDWLQIRAVIEFCQADTFWAPNIQSGQTLRKQWDKLVAKMKQARASPDRGNIVERALRKGEGFIRRGNE